VRWHKLDEVENEFTLDKFILFAISVLKKIIVGENFTKFSQK